MPAAPPLRSFAKRVLEYGIKSSSKDAPSFRAVTGSDRILRYLEAVVSSRSSFLTWYGHGVIVGGAVMLNGRTITTPYAAIDEEMAFQRELHYLSTPRAPSKPELQAGWS